MQSSLITRLSRMVVERPARPPSGKAITEWMEENGLLVHAGRGVAFRAGAIERIENILMGLGVDPYGAALIDDAMPRSQVRRIAAYEKTGGHVLARDRVLIRAIPGNPLRLGHDIRLPEGASLDVGLDEVVRTGRHHAIMVIENRECFDRLEHLTFRPDIYDLEPLVVFRGSPFVSAGSRRLVAKAGLPVHVFGDYDPAGIAIAATMPHAVALVLPHHDVLYREILRAPNHDLHMAQISQAAPIMERAPSWLTNDRDRVLTERCAIPQESFLR